MKADKFDDMYSLDKNGRLRVFKISVSDTYIGETTITSETGLLGGNLVTNRKVISSGKQGRTHTEQAMLIANSSVEEKFDDGYKPYWALRKHYLDKYPNSYKYPEHPYKEEAQLVEELYKELGITWNTSRYWTPLPMLAETYKPGKHKFPMIAQRKYDGVRCIAIPSPVRLCSRGGKYYFGLTHIEQEVAMIFEDYPFIMLDGELYAHGVPFARISGDCRRVERPIFEDVTYIQYHVYDIAVPNKSQRDREKLRAQMYNRFANKLRYIKFVPSTPVSTEAEVKTLHDKYVEQGYEGLILRQYHKPYYFSFRDNALLKVKEFMEEEFVITGCDYDTGKGISSFIFTCQVEDGREFGVRPIGSHSLWEEYLENFHDKIEGKKATVRFLNYSVNGLPEKAVVKAIRDYE